MEYYVNCSLTAHAAHCHSELHKREVNWHYTSAGDSLTPRVLPRCLPCGALGMPRSFGTAGWVASAAAAVVATPVVVCDLARLKRLDQSPAGVGSSGRGVHFVTNRERQTVERCHRPTLRLALLTALAVCVDGERSGVRLLVITGPRSLPLSLSFRI